MAQESFSRVHGTVYYWYNLEPLKNSIVEVNSTPVQIFVAKNGEYAFNLLPGTYVIKASYYRDNILLYYAEENLTLLEGGGEYIVDLIAFPVFEDIEIVDETNLVPSIETQESENIWMIIAAAAGSIILISVLIFYLKKLRKKLSETKVEPTRETIKYVGLPADLQEIIDKVKESDGRITQLELREKLPYSEAKVSLMLTDLESRGLIRRIKKGRGNIIILKE
ncbi:MAG: helix-turn-helix transcriptional regulator [Candidatus Hadarchaeaceae archaeon]